MKTSNRWQCIAVAGMLAAGMITQTLTAEPPVGRGGPFAGQIAEQLHLTPKQQMQIGKILQAEKDTLAPLITAYHGARVGLREAIHADGATEASVLAASANVAEAEAALAVERLKLYTEIRPLLTPAQVEAIKSLSARLDVFVENLTQHLGERTGR